MKIEAFNWKIEVTINEVKVNGQVFVPSEKVLPEQPTDIDGTPLEYGDNMVCVEDFKDEWLIDWRAGEKWVMSHNEFTPSELKNFRKLN